MLKTKKRVRIKRNFSEDLKLQIVHEYESGQFSTLELGRLYGVAVQVIYNWIYKYSKYNKKSIQVVEKKNSAQEKLKDLEQKVKGLEQALGRKQMIIDYLEKMIDLAKDEFDIDIKKNSNTLHSGGSKTTGAK